ncbi:uncharacterized protein LOC144491754 isoform X2 [Mustelus asterias]
MENPVTAKSSSRRGRQPYLLPQEAKRRRLERYRLRRRRMVNIDRESENWQQLKSELGFEKDVSLAKFLLDYYRSHSVPMKFHSDPKAKGQVAHYKRKYESSDTSSTSSSETQSEQCTPSSLMITFPQITAPQLLPTVGSSIAYNDMDTDHNKESLEFMEDSVDVTEHLLPENFINTKLRDCTVEEEVLSIVNDETVSGEEESIPVSLASAQDKSICGMRTGIIFDTCLMSLAKKAFTKCECLDCNGKIDLELHVVATAMKVVIHCHHGHKSVWWSQPLLDGDPAGNFLLVSSIVLSGNNYRKIALMLKFLNMLPVSHQSFLKIQKSYVQPSVTNYWRKMQERHFLGLTRPIVVLGDQCNNSHVLSEKYLTCTMMDNSTHKILDVQVIDAREGTRKLRNLEISGFQRAFQCLMQNNLDVSEVVTDADPQLLMIMKSKYPNILHQLDLWHGIKAVQEKLNQAVSSSDSKDLQPWISDILKHFMFCCQHSNGDINTLMARWRSILHHTVNVHEWQLGDCSTAASCEHGPLTDKEIKEKQWLTAGSPAHHALRKVVYDKWLTSHLNYFVQARYEDYLLRALLAAVDYNSHVDRECKCNADGEIVYHRIYSKRKKHWSVVPAKVQKQYCYFEELKEDMVKAISSNDAIQPPARRLGAKGRRAPAQPRNLNQKSK